jgi:hypothetical protein
MMLIKTRFEGTDAELFQTNNPQLMTPWLLPMAKLGPICHPVIVSAAKWNQPIPK